jgi:hypothetical protein
MDILRISDTHYVVGNCDIKKVDLPGIGVATAWEVRPRSADLNDRPLFTRPTLEETFNFCEGVRRMLAPIGQEADADF